MANIIQMAFMKKAATIVRSAQERSTLEQWAAARTLPLRLV